MSRFTQKEKEQIKSKLITEGERLFTAYGIKKVTIDEITSSAVIAKATFYKFYESKESLYLDIAQNLQQKIFMGLDMLLQNNSQIPGKQRVKLLFNVMYDLMIQYPFLTQINKETIELISRKVSKNRLSLYMQQNLNAVHILEKHNIKLFCAPEVATLAFHALYSAWLSIKDADTATQTKVTELLLDGVIDKVICD